MLILPSNSSVRINIAHDADSSASSSMNIDGVERERGGPVERS